MAEQKKPVLEITDRINKREIGERTEKDDPYIRDIFAAAFDLVFFTIEHARGICAGEMLYCDRCGVGFEMWPLKAWASHQLIDHADGMTLQQHAAAAALATEDVTDAVRQFIATQFMVRVGMRRNARDLGLIRFKASPLDPGNVQ